MRKISILAICLFLLIGGFAISLYSSLPPTAPDMWLTLVGCVEIGKTNGLRTREATFDILNRSDGTVQLYSIAIEQRGNGLPDWGSNSTVVRGPKPTAMRSGERQRVQLRFTMIAGAMPSEFCARCVVIPGAPRNQWLDWFQKQIWLKVFPQKQKKPAVSSYSFSSKWTDN